MNKASFLILFLILPHFGYSYGGLLATAVDPEGLNRVAITNNLAPENSNGIDIRNLSLLPNRSVGMWEGILDADPKNYIEFFRRSELLSQTEHQYLNNVYVASAAAERTRSALSEYGGDLKKALSDIGQKDHSLIIDISATIRNSLIVPANIELVFRKGNVLSVDRNVKITINGPIQAGLYILFRGEGTVTLGKGSVENIYPQWWGATSHDKFDDSVPLKKAFAAADGVADIKLTSGTWLIAGVKITTNVVGSEGALIIQADPYQHVFIQSQEVDVRNLTVNLLPQTIKAAFLIQTLGGHNTHATYTNIRVNGNGSIGTAFNLSANGNYGILNLKLEDIYVHDIRTAIQFNAADGGWINGNTFENIWVFKATYGIDFNGVLASGNLFSAVRGQYPLVSLIYGISGHENVFIGCKRFDGGTTFVATKHSYNNLFLSPEPLLANPAFFFNDEGSQNMFIFPNEDFIFSRLSESFAGASLTNRWRSTVTGTGSVAPAQQKTYGGVQLSTGKMKSSTAQLDFGGKASYSGTSKSRVTFRASLSSTTDLIAELGIQMAGTTRRICFRYKGDGNWFAVTTANNGKESIVDTGISPNTRQNLFQITKMGTDKVLFFINGNNVAEITTNVFTGHYEPFASIESSSNADKALQLSNLDLRLY
jgi:hypothetical protein